MVNTKRELKTRVSTYDIYPTADIFKNSGYFGSIWTAASLTSIILLCQLVSTYYYQMKE